MYYYLHVPSQPISCAMYNYVHVPSQLILDARVKPECFCMKVSLKPHKWISEHHNLGRRNDIISMHDKILGQVLYTTLTLRRIINISLASQVLRWESKNAEAPKTQAKLRNQQFLSADLRFFWELQACCSWLSHPPVQNKQLVQWTLTNTREKVHQVAYSIRRKYKHIPSKSPLRKQLALAEENVEKIKKNEYNFVLGLSNRPFWVTYQFWD